MATAFALMSRAWRQLRDPSAALLLTQFISIVMRLGSNLVLAHLLVPADFGLLAITTLIATALVMLSETGVWVAIVRKGESLDRDWLDQMWTLQALRGVVLWILALVLAPLIADAYNQPQLKWLLPVANLWLIILGLESLRPFVRTRALRPGLSYKLQLVTQVVGSVLSIIGAIIYPSPWALVAGLLGGAAASTILSHIWAREPLPRPHLTGPFLREQWKLASWLIVSTALGFFAGQIDRLIFPTWFGVAAFGIYSMALTLSLFPLQVGMRWGESIYMPAIARLAEDHSEAAERQMRSLCRTVGIYAGLGSAMLAGIGGPFFLALYPPRFAEAAVFVQILAVTTYATFLTYLHRRTFLYQGMTRLEASIEAARTILFVGAIGTAILLGRHVSAKEYVGLYAIVQFVVYGGLLIVGRTKGLVHVRDDLPGHATFAIALLVMLSLALALENNFGALVSFVGCSVVGGSTCLIVAVRLGLPKIPTRDDAQSPVDQEAPGPVDPFEPAQV